MLIGTIYQSFISIIASCQLISHSDLFVTFQFLLRSFSGVIERVALMRKSSWFSFLYVGFINCAINSFMYYVLSYRWTILLKIGELCSLLCHGVLTLPRAASSCPNLGVSLSRGSVGGLLKVLYLQFQD